MAAQSIEGFTAWHCSFFMEEQGIIYCFQSRCTCSDFLSTWALLGFSFVLLLLFILSPFPIKIMIYNPPPPRSQNHMHAF